MATMPSPDARHRKDLWEEARQAMEAQQEATGDKRRPPPEPPTVKPNQQKGRRQELQQGDILTNNKRRQQSPAMEPAAGPLLADHTLFFQIKSHYIHIHTEDKKQSASNPLPTFLEARADPRLRDLGTPKGLHVAPKALYPSKSP